MTKPGKITEVDPYFLCDLMRIKFDILYPEAGLTFGYLGNLTPIRDDRGWTFFTKVDSPASTGSNRYRFGDHKTSDLRELYESAAEQLEPFLRKILNLDEADKRHYFDRSKVMEAFRESPAASTFLYEWIQRADPDKFHWGDIERAVDAAIVELEQTPAGWMPASSFTRSKHYEAAFEKIGSAHLIISKTEDGYVPTYDAETLKPERTAQKAADAIEYVRLAKIAANTAMIADAPSPTSIHSKMPKL